MLESFVTWVLNNYVGEYFRLNTDQLSIALLQGQVDLENVPLRTTALTKFDIPVQVRCGVIGSLQLRIPLAHIRSQPWTLRLRDCLALLGPSSAVLQCHDVQTVDKWQQQRRERWLDELETRHKRKLLEQLGIESTEETAEQDSWWGASLLSSISNNIQVVLENAHIRYECPAYNFGVKIRSLTIQTTNANWRPGFVQSAEGVNIFKKIDITGFSIYWNPTDDSRQQRDHVRLVPSYEMLREELGFSSAECASNQFILLPFSLEVRIEQNSSRLPLLRTVPTTPRFKLDIRSKRIELELNKRQIAQIQSLAHDWAQFERARPHRKWRPLVSVHESPKLWWRFAIGRTRDELRVRMPFFSRATVLTRVRLVNAYARAYRRRLMLCVDLHRDNADGNNDHFSSSPSPISHEDIALIKQIEHGSEFTYNVLHCLKESVVQQMLLKLDIVKKPPNGTPFETISSSAKPQPVEHRQTPAKGSAPTTGWYGWITNWFTEEANGGDKQNELGKCAKEADEALYLVMKPPKLTKHKLDPELEAVETRMEAEILQMLNESWDESTVLRRDNLLAEIVLNVAKVLFRFSEEDGKEGKAEHSSSSLSAGCAAAASSSSSSSAVVDVQLLTFDLSRLCSLIHLSPKEHRTEVSLSVADLTVQRVRHHRHQQQQRHTMPSPTGSSENDEDGKKKAVETVPSHDTDDFGSDEFDNDSLIYGSQLKNAQNTHLLLAIGRTYDENDGTTGTNGKRNRREGGHKSHRNPSSRQNGDNGAAVHHCTSASTSSSFSLAKEKKKIGDGHAHLHRPGLDEHNAMVRLFYKRLAPKLEVYHELNVSCAPLSIICDECALSGILEPFIEKMQQQRPGEEQPPHVDHLEFAYSTTDTVTHQLFASVAIPELTMELRSQKGAHDYLLNPKNGQIVASTSFSIFNESDEFHSQSATTASSSFARGNVRSLRITFSRRDCPMATKLLLTSENLCIWVLEEANKQMTNTTPFLRFNIRELSINKTLDRVHADFGLSIDHYRLRTLPGWEPLLEWCNKFAVDADFTDPTQANVMLKHASGGPMEFTLTQSFIERAIDFVSHLNSVRQIVLDSGGRSAEGLDQLRNLFCQQRKSGGKETHSKCAAVPPTSSAAKKSHSMQYDHHRPYHLKTPAVGDAVLTSTIAVQLELDDGLGFSVVDAMDKDRGQDGQKREELCYGRLSGIKLNVVKSKATYRISCHVNSIQIDNQIIGADRWHFLFCDPGALKDEPVAGLPALAFEMSYAPTEFFDVYECFRLKLSNACILLDEQLLWRLVHFVRCVLRRSRDQCCDKQQKHNETGTVAEGGGGGGERKTAALSPSCDQQQQEKNCYFGTLQLEVGDISLSVQTVDKSALSPSIRQLKDSYSDQIVLFSFENALVTLAPFCWLRCFCSVDYLLDTLANFYLGELKRQKLNIIFAMDAFGNPMALGNELMEGFQGLIFEGDLAGFAFGLGYGAANSISKVTSSMAQGVGSLTFDEKHEELRRQMRRAKPEKSGPLTHLYGGIKGLGVGVFGGLTAIVKNTVTATRKEGLITGIALGVTTGAIDTVTKPLQGTLDLLEGTASAVKEIVGAPLVRRAHFPDQRLRPSRVCSSLSGLLPAYSVESADAQQELLDITGTYTLNDKNRLLCVIPFLVRTNLYGAHVVQRALVSLVQCCIVRQVDTQPSMVTARVLFQHLHTVQLVSSERQQQQRGAAAVSSAWSATPPQQHQQRLALVEFVFDSDDHPHRTHAHSSSSSSSFAYLSQQQHHQQHHQQQRHQHTLTLWCSDRETAKHFCKQIMRAKALFDRRTNAAGDKLLQRKSKLLPIFTI